MESNSVGKCNGERFPVDFVFHGKVSKSHDVPSERKKSDNGNLMNEKSKALLAENPKHKGHLVDGLNGEGENVTTGFLMPRNVVKKDSTNSSYIECFHQPETNVSFAPRQNMRQSVKTKAPMGKLEPLLIPKGKGIEFGIHNSKGKDGFKADNSLLQVSQSVFERQNWKTRYESENKGGIRSLVSSSWKRKGKRSRVIKEKGRMVKGRSSSKKFQWVDGNIKSQPNEEQKAFDVPAEHEEVDTYYCGRLPFSGSDKKARLKDTASRPQKRRRYNRHHQSDTICLACHYGGKLILCETCRSSYHLGCIGLEIFGHLRQILGKSSIDGLSWTMLRSGKNDIYLLEAPLKIDNNVKLSHARAIMQECFEPIIEPHSKRNLIVDILFNRISKFKRMGFHGFYTMVLQTVDEVICVATVRIHGLTVAELPLIGTCFQYRQQGMCRLLINELEKMLNQLGVERLVLPAVPDLSQTWKNSFGFTEMSHDERLELLPFPLLFFQGTTMYQKFLNKTIREKSGGPLKNSVMASGFHNEKENQGGNFKRKNTTIGKENMVEICNGI